MSDHLLQETDFNAAKPYFSVEVTGDGLTVYSECCADTMTAETARLVHEALGAWLQQQS